MHLTTSLIFSESKGEKKKAEYSSRRGPIPGF
jgi:hypothetical protein